MLVIFSLSVLESCRKHCFCLFLCIAVRQFYERGRRDLELGCSNWHPQRFASIRRMDRVPNARIRDLREVMKGIDERIVEGVLWWFGHVERMENDRFAKRVYLGVYAGSHSAGRNRKRWIDTVKECLRKRGLDIGQAKRKVQDKNEWLGFVEENAWDIARGMNH